MRYHSSFPIHMRALVLLAIANGSSSDSLAAAANISGPEKRRTAVELAGRLAVVETPSPVPPALPVPFSPPGFELTDAQERAAKAAAGKANAAPRLVSDRETLEEIAAKIPPTGTIFLPNGEARLMFGTKPVKIGDRFTLPLNGQTYDLELVNIDRTTFTLRLNREEITRPVKPAKSQ